jgi:hypothetical protein
VRLLEDLELIFGPNALQFVNTEEGREREIKTREEVERRDEMKTLLRGRSGMASPMRNPAVLCSPLKPKKPKERKFEREKKQKVGEKEELKRQQKQ